MTGTHAAFIAATRFGLGAGPKELTSIGPDPQGWLLSQLSQPATHPRELMNQPSAASRITEYLKVRKGSRDLKETIRKQFKKDYMREAGLRSLTALRSDTAVRHFRGLSVCVGRNSDHPGTEQGQTNNRMREGRCSGPDYEGRRSL